MSGPATIASQTSNFLVNHQQPHQHQAQIQQQHQHPHQHPHQHLPQLQHPQPHQQHQQPQHQHLAANSPAPIGAEQSPNTPRGQVNAWGWPSGFNNQMSSGNLAGPSKPPFQQAPQPQGQMLNMYNGQPQQQHQHQHQHQQNHIGATVYPPQPYGAPQAFGNPTQAASSLPATGGVNQKASTGNLGASASIGMRKRNASNSPEGDGNKRSRPDDANQSSSMKKEQATSGAEGRVWGEEATKLDVYVWDYLSRRGFSGAAKALMSEAGMAEPPEVPLKTPQGLLFEYWAIFWDVFAARTGRGSTEATAYFEYQESRQMQRLVEATRKGEALEAAYHAPENAGRFPTITVAGVPIDPAALNGHPMGQATWNPATLPQVQQQQLLIAAAQRQNIPIHEIKNLTPATRMALINSMNPHNAANPQALRPGMNSQQMEQQLQARLQQQQTLHRMMQQQRQGGATPMGVVGAGQPMPAGLQARPPNGGLMAAGSPAHPQVGTSGVPDGRRSVGPIAGPQPDPNRPEQAPGVLPTTQLPPQPGQGPPGHAHQQQSQQQQHPQLNPQQQQAVFNQYQSVQAAMREEWMKAQNASNPASAQDFYANVQSYQAKAQSLQALLRAQTNYTPQAQPGGPPPPPPQQQQQPTQPQQPGAQPQQQPSQLQQQQQQQQQQMQMQQQMQQQMQMQGRPGGPPMTMGATGAQPMPNNVANMTPQQRAAHMANAQAAAGRITPAMATHDPGLMTSMMGPGGMPNGAPRAPTPHESSSQQQHQQQQQQQVSGPARPPSSQGRPEDGGPNNFNQTISSPAGAQRPNMQRTASSQIVGGMGPPGPQSISSPSPRTQASTLQQHASQQQNVQVAGSPAGNVPNTPKMGTAEKIKKGAARQRNTKAGANTKTPTLSAAAVPSSNGPANANGPGASTPAQAQTPASTSAPTPGRDGQAPATAQTPSKKGNGNGNGAGAEGGLPSSQGSSQPAAAASAPSSSGAPATQAASQSMPPPGVPTITAQPAVASMASDASSAIKTGMGGGDLSNPSGDATGNGAGGLGNDDFSMFGFGGSMNDIFDFDLSTDGTGGGSTGLGGDAWDSNFGSLFSGTDGMNGS